MGLLLILSGEARASSWQVELLEDSVAQLMEVGSGKSTVVPRSTLPPQAREGDLLVNGQVDQRATAEAIRSLQQTRRRAFPER
jgi:hypothetical protein